MRHIPSPRRRGPCKQFEAHGLTAYGLFPHKPLQEQAPDGHAEVDADNPFSENHDRQGTNVDKEFPERVAQQAGEDELLLLDCRSHSPDHIPYYAHYDKDNGALLVAEPADVPGEHGNHPTEYIVEQLVCSGPQVGHE